MRIAIVHDDFLQWGGAERVVQAISEIWPNAPIFTSFVDSQIKTKFFPHSTIIESPLKHIPFAKKHRRAALPMYPFCFKRQKLDDFDLVLSSTTRFAHTVPTSKGTLHIAYCHTPPRYFWDFDGYIKHEKHTKLLYSIKPLIAYFQKNDRQAAAKVNHFIANSEVTKKRIATIYKRPSTVIPPFVDTSLFKPDKRVAQDDYFLVVARLLSWKRVDIAIEACRLLNKKLVIIGKGPDISRLKDLAHGSKTEFVDSLTDEQLVTYYRKSMALIQPQEEDFGMTALEAMACGTPVIAFGKGGAKETIVEGKTGLFFPQQYSGNLVAALKKFEKMSLDSQTCVNQAHMFTKHRFQKQLADFITKQYNTYHG